MTRIKICGLRRKEDIQIINALSPDYIGFILSPGFKRTVSFEEFVPLAESIRCGAKKTGVFVNEPVCNILKFAPYLDAIQLHGSEDSYTVLNVKELTNLEVIKAVRAKSKEDINAAQSLCCDKLLIDAYKEGHWGGTGQTADWSVVKSADIKKPFFIAGGISAQNAESAVNALSPFGVDVSSSVETDGFKDFDKVKEIISIVRKEEKHG